MLEFRKINLQRDVENLTRTGIAEEMRMCSGEILAIMRRMCTLHWVREDDNTEWCTASLLFVLC